jgi:hypothetical protein
MAFKACLTVCTLVDAPSVSLILDVQEMAVRQPVIAQIQETQCFLI